MSAATLRQRLVVCIANDGYAASLEPRKIYVSLRDVAAEKHGLIRVIDESGENYLFPETLFMPADLPPATKRAVLAVASSVAGR